MHPEFVCNQSINHVIPLWRWDIEYILFLKPSVEAGMVYFLDQIASSYHFQKSSAEARSGSVTNSTLKRVFNDCCGEAQLSVCVYNVPKMVMSLEIGNTPSLVYYVFFMSSSVCVLVCLLCLVCLLPHMQNKDQCLRVVLPTFWEVLCVLRVCCPIYTKTCAMSASCIMGGLFTFQYLYLHFMYLRKIKEKKSCLSSMH